MKFVGRFLKDTLRNYWKDHLLGIHLAFNIFVASLILWWLLRQEASINPIWAISSMVAVVNPQINQVYQTFRAQLFNTLLGCTTGFLFLFIHGSNMWKLPVCLAVTSLLSSYVVRIPAMWRQAPITAAIVIAAIHTDHSKLASAELGLQRVAEVLLGCLVGLFVTWVTAKIWPLPKAENEEAQSV